MAETLFLEIRNLRRADGCIEREWRLIEIAERHGRAEIAAGTCAAGRGGSQCDAPACRRASIRLVSSATGVGSSAMTDAVLIASIPGIVCRPPPEVVTTTMLFACRVRSMNALASCCGLPNSQV